MNVLWRAVKMNVITLMYENGVFENRHKGIIEIYPHRAMNSYSFNMALKELIKQNYKLVKIANNWIRAFK